MNFAMAIDTKPVFEAMNFAINNGLLNNIKAAIEPLLDTQAAYAVAFQKIGSSDVGLDRAGTLAHSNLGTAQMVQNISGLASIVMDMNSPPSWLETVTRGLPAITDAFRGVVAGQLNEVLADHRIWSRVAVPSIAFEGYTRALRIEADERDRPDPHPAPRRFEIELDARLRRVDAQLPSLRVGAWHALEGDNPDRWRHAASSHRELIRMVLAALVPDAEETPDVRHSKMRKRIREIVESDSSADFVLELEKAMVAIYQYLNKPCHTTYRHDAIQGALVAGEGLLLFLLSHVED